MPLVHDPFDGWLLHPVDLSINKLLALDAQGIVLHFGCPGGVVPQLTE